MATRVDTDQKKRQADGLVGQVLDQRYRIIDKLGAGGVGDVYRAEHLRLRCPVAVKVLQPAYVESERLRVRFEREAQALSALSHPNVVAVSDYGVDDVPFLVMELLRGKTLGRAIKDGPMEPAAAFEVTRQILRALAFAHQEGLVHRDLKPGNVYLQPLVDGAVHVKILDFGLAKFVAGDRRSGGPQVTVTGMVFGTPAYMSPEQATGMEVDHRTDLYAAGIVLYEMLSGRRPFMGETDELMRQQLLAPVPPLAETCPSRRFSPELDRFFQRSLAKERSERFSDAQTMLTELNELHVEPVLESGSAVTEALGAAACSGPTPEVQPTAPTALSVPARAASPETISAELLRPWRLVLVGGTGGFVAALVVAAAVGVVWWGVSGRQSAGAERGAGAASAALSALAPVNTHSRQSDAGLPALPPGAAAELWGGELPVVVARTKAVLDAGRILPAAQLRALRAYSMRNREDPRPLLLLARNCIRRSHLTDGIIRYERAFAASPDARYDSQVLPDLLNLVPNRTVGRRAARAIERIYGPLALGAVRQFLESSELDDGARRRFQELEGRLQ